MATYIKNGKQNKLSEIKKVYRKWNEVWEAIHRLPTIKLDKPRFSGYKRFFVLRDDIAHRKDATDLRNILFLINEVRLSKTKDFSKHDVDDKPWGSKQRIKTLSEKQFLALNPHQKKFFDKWVSSDIRKKEVRYIFQYPYFFVYKIKQHYITEVPVIDTELESLKRELSNKMDIHDWWPIIDHMLYGRKGNWERDYTGAKARIIASLEEKEMILELERLKDINGY